MHTIRMAEFPSNRHCLQQTHIVAMQICRHILFEHVHAAQKEKHNDGSRLVCFLLLPDDFVRRPCSTTQHGSCVPSSAKPSTFCHIPHLYAINALLASEHLPCFFRTFVYVEGPVAAIRYAFTFIPNVAISCPGCFVFAILLLPATPQSLSQSILHIANDIRCPISIPLLLSFTFSFHSSPCLPAVMASICARKMHPHRHRPGFGHTHSVTVLPLSAEDPDVLQCFAKSNIHAGLVFCVLPFAVDHVLLCGVTCKQPGRSR